MVAVCFIELLPNELVTQIILRCIKGEPVIRLLILRNRVCGTFRRIYDSYEVLLHVSLREHRQVCKNHYVRSLLEERFCLAKHPEALCFEGMERLMRRQNSDEVLNSSERPLPRTPVRSTS